MFTNKLSLCQKGRSPLVPKEEKIREETVQRQKKVMRCNNHRNKLALKCINISPIIIILMSLETRPYTVYPARIDS